MRLSLGRDTGGSKVHIALYVKSKDTTRPIIVKPYLAYYYPKTHTIHRLTDRQLRIGRSKGDKKDPRTQIFRPWGHKYTANFKRIELNAGNGHETVIPFRVASSTATYVSVHLAKLLPYGVSHGVRLSCKVATLRATGSPYGAALAAKS